MSSDDSKFNADCGSRHDSDSGSDIRLPPISFLSGHGRQHNKLPSASNMGISSYLSHPAGSYSSQSPESNDEHTNKKTKLEDTDAELLNPRNSQDKDLEKSALLGLYNAANLSPKTEFTLTNKIQDHDRAIGQHSHASSNSFNHSHNNQAHNTHSGFIPHTHTNPHHHHHHHHHHHVHRDSPGDSSPNGVPHMHERNHVHILARGEDEASVPERRQVTQETEKKMETSLPDEIDTEKFDSNPTKTEGEKEVPYAANKQSGQQEPLQANDSQMANDIAKNGENATAGIAPKSSPRIKSQRVTIDKSQLLEILRTLFPDRLNLGTLMYNPTTTWSTLQTAQLTGLKPEDHERFQQLKEDYEDKLKEEYFRNNFKYIPMIPPLPNDYINHLLEIKIPYRFIKLFKENLECGKIPLKRQIWGGASGIYTDDSDILLVLAHLGLFNRNMNLTEWNEKWTSDDIITPLNAKNDPNEIYGDLSVIILLLPPLPDYHGYYQNGVNSRPWVCYNKHNGLSYAVYDVKWEGYGSYLRDKMLFKRYQTELYDDIVTTKEQLSSKKGWSFNFEYYKQLKHKFEILDKQNPEKKPKDSSKMDNS